MPRTRDIQSRRTSQGGTLYGEFVDTHGDMVRVARVALIGTEFCRVQCNDAAGDDQAMVIDRDQATALVEHLTKFINDSEPAVRLVRAS